MMEIIRVDPGESTLSGKGGRVVSVRVSSSVSFDTPVRPLSIAETIAKDYLGYRGILESPIAIMPIDLQSNDGYTKFLRKNGFIHENQNNLQSFTDRNHGKPCAPLLQLPPLDFDDRVPFKIAFDMQKDVDGLAFMCMPEVDVEYDDYEKAVEHLTFCANHDVDFSVFRYMQTLEQEFRAQRHGYREMLDCVTRELLLALARRTMEKESRTGLDYIVRYLDEYFMEDINIDGLVKMSGFSPSQFRLLFKQKMRVSPKQYILTKRLERIRDRLINSAIPLSEIAVECGFGDYYQFSAFFKRREGLSPKEFRKRFQVTEL